MARNLRNRDYTFQPVETYTVAPHLFTDDLDEAYREAESYNEFKAGMPYKPGDVVYLLLGEEVRKAIITDVYPERDRFGDRREKYRVHVANKKGGMFAKNWIYTWPGFIQRGYQTVIKLGGNSGQEA